MKTRTQVTGTMAILAAMLATSFLPMEPKMHALAAALILTVGGGAMAYFRSRNISR